MIHDDDYNTTTLHKFIGYSGSKRVATPRPLTPEDKYLPRKLRLESEDGERHLEIVLRRFMLVGRSVNGDDANLDVDLTPLSAYRQGVSRCHLVLESSEQQGILIKDTSSKNGTWLNGERLQPLTYYRLRDSDKLKLGELTMIVHFIY